MTSKILYSNWNILELIYRSRMIVLNNSTSRLKMILTYGVTGCSIAALIIYLIIIGGNSDALPFLTFEQTGFNFHVYCPIDTPLASQTYLGYFGSNYYNSRTTYNQSNLYVVYMQSKNVTTPIFDKLTGTWKNVTSLGFYYCGLAREWNGDCKDSKMICSSPGPTFYLPVNQEATIIWVNNITSQQVVWTEQGCYSPNSLDSSCMIDAKIIDPFRPQTEGCTYNLPTNYSFSTRQVRINKTQVPVSPHIHGIQTRPAFDGNPLSWFNNVGDRGVGFFSLNDSIYYSLFEKQEAYLGLPMSNQKKSMKIVKVLNRQPAGNLFYHDHAMKSTKFNVASGLSGLYILYNKTAQASLPTGAEEKFILFSHKNDGDIRNATTWAPPQASTYHPSMQNIQQMHPDTIYTLDKASDTYSRNMTYRYRILNAHYDNVYYNISFGVYFSTTTLPDGTKINTQINPYTTSFPLTQDLTKINFTVIGTDSTLFNIPINNVNTFDLGVAERMELLIKFGSQIGIPSNINNFYLICYDKSVDDYVIKYRFNLNQLTTSNKYLDPVQTKPLPVSFYNLSTYTKSQVAVNRMRPLLSRPSDMTFLINGHYMYDMGETDNPKIGTVEDWYIINNLFEPHPIHLHLVNHQTVQTYSLKLTPEGCTLYELDFFRFSNYPPFVGLNDTQLCQFLNAMTMADTMKLYHFLDTYNPQTKIVNANIGKVSGLNVMETISTAADITKYARFSECDLNSIYKYICGDTSSSIKPQLRRWKDTSLVKQYSVSVLRVRWASTNYDQKIKAYPYFEVPEDELMEFPGFAYHCHILPHEDNEMMRPFMLKASDSYIQKVKKQTPSGIKNINNFLSSQQIQSLNLNSIALIPEIPIPGNGFIDWLSKAKQINSVIGCRP